MGKDDLGTLADELYERAVGSARAANNDKLDMEIRCMASAHAANLMYLALELRKAEADKRRK